MTQKQYVRKRDKRMKLKKQIKKNKRQRQSCASERKGLDWIVVRSCT